MSVIPESVDDYSDWTPEQLALRRADPLDYLAGLARADALSESGDEIASHLERGRAWMLAWAVKAPGCLRRILGNRGQGFSLAYFGTQPSLPPAARKRRSKLPPPPKAPVILFRVDRDKYVVWRGADSPGLTPREGPSNLPFVRAGASVAELVRAVEMAQGHWLPIEV